jgi:hypothetical protein
MFKSINEYITENKKDKKKVERFELNHYLDKTIENFSNIGNLNYYITINFKNNINKNINNYDNLLKYKSEELICIVNSRLEMWTYLSINCEENEDGDFHFHCMLGLRSIIGFNEDIGVNIKNVLRDYYEVDSYIVESKDIVKVKINIHYCYKDVFKFHNFCSFFFISNWQDCCSDLLDIFLYLNLNITIRGYSQNSILDNLQGVKIANKIEKDDNKNIILNMWNYYLTLNNYYIYNNCIFEKVENYEISYKKKYKISFLYENIHEVISFFINLLPTQFVNYNFYEITSKYIMYNEQLIQTLKLVTTNKIKPNFNLLEFKDGIYNMKLNKFIPKKIFKKLNPSPIINTIKFYNRTYKHLAPPKNWLNIVYKTLEDSDEAKSLFLFFANIFHHNNKFFKKKKVLFIVGKNNTLKTTLIVKPLINFFGEENVGIIISDLNSNFQLQDVCDKIIVVIDEYKHNDKIEGFLLKWFEGSDIKSEQRFKIFEILDNKPTILVSNEYIKAEDSEIQNAFNNRIIKLLFKYKIKPDEIDDLMIDEINNEEAAIMIHCNKVYFNFILNNKKTRMNYNRMSILINYENNKDEN